MSINVWADPAREAQLRTLWDDGVPAAEIGRALNCTKLAILAKAGRLGLRRRPLRIDLTGQTFTRLTVRSYAGNDRHRNARWNCVCSCGNTTVVRGLSLKSGAIKSCGCLAREWGRTVGLSNARGPRADA